MIGRITLQVRPSKNQISLLEPVFVECILSNRSAAALRIDLGPGGVEAFRVTVRASTGNSLGEFRRTCPGAAARGKIEIAPRAEHHRWLLLQDWYRFAAPGRYSVGIGVLLEGVRIEGEPFVIDVSPRDPDRLRESCEALTTRALAGGVTASAVEAAQALGHVADPIAIPFLERLLAGNSVMRRQALQGLGRVDDEAARALLQGLSHDSNDETAALARQALRGVEGSGTVTD